MVLHPGPTASMSRDVVSLVRDVTMLTVSEGECVVCCGVGVGDISASSASLRDVLHMY